MTAPYIVEVFSLSENRWVRIPSAPGLSPDWLEAYVAMHTEIGVKMRVIQEGKIVMEGD